jgi:hypothetical protein
LIRVLLPSRTARQDNWFLYDWIILSVNAIFGEPSRGRKTLSESPWHPENEVERLLCSLAGVVSARVVANPLGRLDEIHILASPLFSPKQIVRNVESALSAGLGIVIDRRIVSVAQIRRDALEPATLPESDEERAEPITTHVGSPRFVFVSYDTENQTNAEAHCNVTIRRDGRQFTGTGSGPSTPAGRVLAGARAVFQALSNALEQELLGLESATVVEANGRSFVLVAARVLEGRATVPLTGVAPLGHSPEEAAIFAALQATNRWTGRDD